MNLTLGLTSNELFTRGFQAAYRHVSKIDLELSVNNGDSCLVSAATENDKDFLYWVWFSMLSHCCNLQEKMRAYQDEKCFGLGGIYLEEFPSDIEISGDDWKPFLQGFQTALKVMCRKP